MRSIVRGAGWALILGGIIGQLWGPDDRTYVPHLVIGFALVFAAANRKRREETDYTAVMLQNAGYADPDATLPTGVQAASTSRNRPGLAFLTWLVVMGLLIWPIYNTLFDRVKDAVDSDSVSTSFDSSDVDADFDFDVSGIAISDIDMDESAGAPGSVEEGLRAGTAVPSGVTFEPMLGMFTHDLPENVISQLIALTDASWVSQVQISKDSASLFPATDGDPEAGVSFAYATLDTDAGEEPLLKLSIQQAQVSTTDSGFDPNDLDYDLVDAALTEGVSEYKGDSDGGFDFDYLNVLALPADEYGDFVGPIVYIATVSGPDAAASVWIDSAGDRVF